MKRVLAACLLTVSGTALADSNTVCTRSALGTFVNCTTTNTPDPNQGLSNGLNSLSQAIIARSARKKAEKEAREAAQAAPPFVMPDSYKIDESGNIFLDVCYGDFRGGRDFIGAGACAGYIAGFVDRDKYLAPEQRRMCVPSEVTGIQARDVVNTYLVAHPAERHLPTALSVDRALTGAFPCGSSAAP